jgi:hypothetical protein
MLVRGEERPEMGVAVGAPRRDAGDAHGAGGDDLGVDATLELVEAVPAPSLRTRNATRERAGSTRQ